MVKPHADFDRIARRCAALASHAAKPFSGVGFRFATLRYGRSRDLLSGEGARKAGGRLNASGTFPVIYTSTDPLTATAEAFQNFLDFGFAPQSVRPRVVVGLKITLTVVLDLCDARIRRRLGVTLSDLAQNWWRLQESGHEALPQAVGRAAYQASFEGVLLPSMRRRGGRNLNLFPERLRPDSVVKVLAEEDLQRHLQ